MSQRNEGIINNGSMNMIGNAVGRNAQVIGRPGASKSAAGSPVEARRADVGVITILANETQAVQLALGLRREPIKGLNFNTGVVDGISVAAIRTLAPGQRSVMSAYDHLVRHFDPDIVVLTGIGGGFHKNVSIGDVIISTEMVYYDQRKITPSGTQPRGDMKSAPAAVGHAVNQFFTDHDPPIIQIEDLSGTSRPVTLHSGPIGSGEAVIADTDAEELKFLLSFNNKILAVDMEAGGLSQACHERSADTHLQHKWAVIRGSSDDASPNKGDEFQRLAAWHAAVVLRKLLSYITSR